MPSYVELFCRKGRLGLALDFHRKREIVRANTALIEGIELETIAPGVNGYKPGMVLIKAEWINFYFLSARDGWTVTQYFDLAAQLMRRKGITKP